MRFIEENIEEAVFRNGQHVDVTDLQVSPPAGINERLCDSKESRSQSIPIFIVWKVTSMGFRDEQHLFYPLQYLRSTWRGT